MVKKKVKKKVTTKPMYEVGYKKPDPRFQFKKGTINNPTGTKKPKEVRAMESLTEKAIQEVIELVMTGKIKDIKQALKSEELSLAHRIIIKAALKAEKDGSFHQLNEILNRAVGTIKQKLDHSSSDGSMSPAQSVNFYLPQNKREDDK